MLGFKKFQEDRNVQTNNYFILPRFKISEILTDKYNNYNYITI